MLTPAPPSPKRGPRSSLDAVRRGGVGAPTEGGRLTIGQLIYSTITSLDGYVADKDGNFDWAAPDEEVHAFVNDLERLVGAYLYGRRMYETMVYWETAPALADQPPVEQDYAEIWQAADKIVFYRTLEAVSSTGTRIERDFDPPTVVRMKAEADRDISVGGPVLAGQAIRAGLVDKLHLFVMPAVVGGGTLPPRRCPPRPPAAGRTPLR